MIRCEVFEVHNLTEVCALLNEHGTKAKIIAGGQNLITLLKNRQIAPSYLININNGRLDLEYVVDEGETIRIGTLTKHRVIETSPLIKEKLSVLAEVEHELGCVQTRNWGTIGGNLCQASPATDLAPIMIALGARCLVQSIDGTREIPMKNFFLDYQKTALKTDEVLVEIRIPALRPSAGAVYRKEATRFADPPIASLGAFVKVDGNGVIVEARILLQAVCVTPLRAVEAEQMLIGEKLTDKLLDKAAISAAATACPISDVYGSVEYKREMIKVLAKRNIHDAVQRALAG